ncbi:hypothetical protein PAXRUDRAFT_824267 [Paxillus rubicundulus Ve08.2h10]|uniref:CSN8/PSMD8/EIF3K domain-containing protein n=1 Tax=Paxillus rubicundulus Ve08.2h10 TaxID=930991 RepID=A0A0D0E7Y5_9AGAM|nr:hypothetical protein PAXRUDRAFT_824267 [Paxillus rubicundulus Ve08.2h10]
MAQGPPTPPPTSATELRDEARDAHIPPSAASASQSSTGPPPTPDQYLQAFPQIRDLALRSDFAAVVQYAELHDLNGVNDKNYTRLLLITPLILAYLVLDDLTPAQHVLTRMPENLLHHHLSQALTHLLASTFDRKYANIYSRAQALCTLVQQPDFWDATLAKIVTFMTAVFLESFRQRTLGLLRKAFASIKVSQAQIYLGSTREQLLNTLNHQKASSGHWEYDSVTDTFRPIDATGADSTKLTVTAPSSLGTFQLVANGLTKVEV